MQLIQPNIGVHKSRLYSRWVPPLKWIFKKTYDELCQAVLFEIRNGV